MEKFSHIDDQGKAKMVDVGDKKPQRRTAIASGCIFLSDSTIKLIKDNQIKKGDCLTVAQIAGIYGAKKTSDLIALCHPLTLDNIDVALEIDNNAVIAKAKVKCTGKTGVEMEALTAVSIALLNIYDMCKAVDKGMVIGEIKLIEKVKEDVN